MGLFKDLGYRINRMFNGESGEVVDVGILPEFLNSGPADDNDKYPDIITFKNPLGELCTQNAGFELVRHCREYKIGGRFP
jgi:hypothetical protein